MRSKAVLRIFISVFLIMTTLGNSQTYAQEEAVDATPVVELEDESRDAPTDASDLSILADGSSDASVETITITGLVTDEQGVPLGGAEVCAMVSSLSLYYSECAFSKEDGSYIFEDVPDYYGSIQASLDGYWPEFSILFEPSGKNQTIDISLRGIATISISGQVTDDKGTSLVGAEVCAYDQIMGFQECAVSGEGGIYVISSMQNGSIRVSATLDGYWAADPVYLDSPIDNTVINFELEAFKLISISGRVTDDNTSPLVGANVCVWINGTSFSECVSSGADGYYAVENVPNGDGGIYATLDGHWNNDDIRFDAPGENTTIDVVLREFKLITISGQVTDENDSPLAGAEVCVRTYDFSECVFSGENGSYIVNDVPNGDITTYATLDEYWWSNWVDLDPPRKDVTVDFQLRAVKLISISGQVTDESGRPLVGAEICAGVDASDGWVTLCADSDEDGHYIIKSVPNGSIWIYTTLSGYRTPPVTIVSPTEDVTFSPVMKTGEYVSIFGQITNEEGVPLPGVRVCREVINAPTSSTCTRSDASGTYLFPGINANAAPPFFISSGDPAWSFSSEDWFEVHDDVEANFTAVPVEVNPNRVTMAGQVVDINGNPINQFTICSQAEGSKFGDVCVTYIDGSNEFEESVYGGYVRLHAEDCPAVYVLTEKQAYEKVWAPGLNDLGTFTLNCEWATDQPDERFAISGLITDEDSAAVAAATICVTGTSQCTVSGADGSYTLADVANGAQSITAGAPGFVSQSLPVTVADENAVLNFTLVAESNPEPGIGAVSGVITDESDAPLADATICVTGTSQCTVSGADGSYTLADVANGAQSITAGAPGFVSQSLPVTVAGESVVLNFTLVAETNPGPGVGTVSGVVTDNTGAPIAGATICAGETCATSGDDGSYALTLAPGTHDVTVKADGFVPQSQSAVVPTDGGVYELSFQLVPVNDGNGNSGTPTPDDGHNAATPNSGETSDTNSEDTQVTNLPNTGAGTVNGTTSVVLVLGVAASALMMAGGLAIRQKRR